MSVCSRTEDLLTAKNRLGQLCFIEFHGMDIVTAHAKLGEQVRSQVHKILARKLESMNPEQIVDAIRLIRSCRTQLGEKSLSSQVDSRIRAAIVEYLECLSSWARGLELEKFTYDRIKGFLVDGEPLSPDDLALFMQNDSVGCQTGVYRDKDGSIILWHTEEDAEDEPFSRFDKVRIASFRLVDGDEVECINAFIYPDLLPGPAFNWRDSDVVQAVDTLFVKQNAQNGSMLANVASWITMRLGNKVDPREIIEVLGPFFDGYALTIVGRRTSQEISAQKLEFAGDLILQADLASEPGCYLFQANVFSRRDEAIAGRYEDIDADYRANFENRVSRTKGAIDAVRTLIMLCLLY